MPRLLHQLVLGLLFLWSLGIPYLVLLGTGVAMAQDQESSQDVELEFWRDLLQGEEELEAFALLDTLTPTVIVDETPSPTDQYNATSFPSPSPTTELEDVADLSSSPTLSAHNAPDTLQPSMIPTAVEQPEPQETPQDDDEGNDESSEPSTDSGATGHDILGHWYRHGWYPSIHVVALPTILFLAGLHAVLLF